MAERLLLPAPKIAGLLPATVPVVKEKPVETPIELQKTVPFDNIDRLVEEIDGTIDNWLPEQAAVILYKGYYLVRRPNDVILLCHPYTKEVVVAGMWARSVIDRNTLVAFCKRAGFSRGAERISREAVRALNMYVQGIFPTVTPLYA